MTNPLTVIFIGPQGSGKGTQIGLLRSVLEATENSAGILEIQTGNLFREFFAGEKTYSTKKVQEDIVNGELQPLFLAASLWTELLRKQGDDKKHFLIEGSPRHLAEAELMEGVWQFYRRRELVVINLDTPEKIILKRMAGRGRADDTAAGIEKRLAWYREQTLPVLDFYRTRPATRVIDIDGSLNVNEVQHIIIRALNL